MKTIQPIIIWNNGQDLEAKILNSYAVNVTLGKSATFYFSLNEENLDGSLGNQVSQGNLTMSGDDYKKWEADSYAWDWIASQLKLTIIGDYVPPTPIIPVPVPPMPEITEPNN